MLSCSSGFVIRHCKPRCGQVLPSLTISSKPLSSFLSFTLKTRFRAYYPSLARSASNPDGNSSPLSSFSSPSAAIQSAGIVPKIKFCQSCGGPTKHDIPEGDDKMRAICTSCGKIAYQNPKMVVGCLIEHNSRVLLCKRKIQPSYGLWTLPAGFLEVGESAVEGAIRETREEANADVEVLSTFAQLDIPLIGHTYIIFLAKLKKHHYSPGSESSECQLFPLDDIPFNSLSFSAMAVTLSLYLEDVKAGKPKFHYGTINKRYSHFVFEIMHCMVSRKKTIYQYQQLITTWLMIGNCWLV